MKYALALLALSMQSAWGASQLACHYTYGGETHTVRTAAQGDPYTVAPIEVGSYLLFRPVFESGPRGLAAVKLYTYVNHTSGPALIHQASYPLPVTRQRQYGFTGLQIVYEPVRDSELRYWCEMESTR